MIGKLLTFYRGRFYAHSRKCCGDFTNGVIWNSPITTPNWAWYAADFASRRNVR